MSIKYSRHYSTRQTPQSEPIPGETMVPNSAGGYTFAVDEWTRLERFLILGNEGGSYYASERRLTVENATCVEACLAADAARAVRTIVEISDAGRAPKNDPAVFALSVYDFLTWAQERLTTILLSGLGSGAEDEEEDA